MNMINRLDSSPNLQTTLAENGLESQGVLGERVITSTTRISVAADGTQGNGNSTNPSLGSDFGIFVPFSADADNLVPGDDNGVRDIFVGNRGDGLTLVSVNEAGEQGNGASTNPAIGRFGELIAFESVATNLILGGNGIRDIYVRDLFDNRTIWVSAIGNVGSNGNSFNPVISPYEDFIAFESDGTNLLPPGVDRNGVRDIFVRELSSGLIERVSVKDGTTEEGNGSSFQPSLSGKGNFVAFESDASDLVAGDTNKSRDVFVRDRQTNRTRRVSVANGNFQVQGNSTNPVISEDGRFVVFQSDAEDLVADDKNGHTDIFVHELETGQTTRVSLSDVELGNIESNGDSFNPAIVGDSISHFIVFESEASNLVSNDTNGVSDIFVHELETGKTTRVSVNSDGIQGNGASGNPSIAFPIPPPFGSFQRQIQVAFESVATNLVPQDTNGFRDIFLYEEIKIDTSPLPKSDFNFNGVNDILYQSTVPVGSLQSWSIFFDPLWETFDVFQPQVNTPGLIAGAIGTFDGSLIPADASSYLVRQILYYDPTTGDNFLFNPNESPEFRWSFLKDPNNPEAILRTPGVVPKAAADFNRDGIFEIVYRNESNSSLPEDQNLVYNPVTRQFQVLNFSEDLPLTAGQLDGDPALEIVYGDSETGEYRIYDFDSGIFSNLFADPQQTAQNYLAVGTLNVDRTQPDLVVFQSQIDAQTVTYKPVTGNFEDILTTTPSFQALA